MVSNKTILILVIVNIILVVLIIIALIWFIGVNEKTPVAIVYAAVPGDTNYTITEIIQKGQQDISFCDTLSRESYKEMCRIENIKYRAQQEKNPAICEELQNAELIKLCKESVV